jgi:hypothetical protein
VNKLEHNDLKKLYEVLDSVSSGRGDVTQDELYQILTQVNVCAVLLFFFICLISFGAVIFIR